MSIARVDNIFSQEEIDYIENIISGSEHTIYESLGRTDVVGIEEHMPSEIIDRLTDIARSVSGLPLKINHAMAVEYNSLYGKPNLKPHLDGDINDLIINMQLESNTVWDIGLNLQRYTLNDNSALVFNANKEIHWRVHKEFEEGEYVRMLFIRFYNPGNISDYSHLRYSQDHEIFKDAREFRDGYPQPDKA
jgi:hypothetical protein